VYVGEDVRLRRLVAIKVLHPALAGDAAFLRRFQAEAQIVAALRHPNILRVYDWGQDEDTPFLVMELLAGGSLRALLDRGQLLSPAQAAAVGADAARALDYAHRRGLVHRDIKPANLIFDEEGRLTVADFGLARALAEATWTEPAGAVVGTARYAAPEQVRGESLDSRADVYALSLVLIEATTGVVPFAADTTLATLMARIDRPLRVPEDLGPLGPVLESAGTVNPAERLDALALARALDGVVAKLPPPAALPLAGLVAGRDVEADGSPTDYPGHPRPVDRRLLEEGFGPAAAGSAAPDLGAADGPAEAADTSGPGPGWPPAGEVAASEDRWSTAATGSVEEAPPTATSGAGPAPTRSRRGRRLVAGLAAGLLVAAAVAGALHFTRAQKPTHPVPDLIGDTEAAAAARLQPLHLQLQIGGSVYDARARTGTVVDQRPATGRLKEGGRVVVTLSRGPRPVAVPDVQALTVGDATALLQRAGLKAAVSHQSSPTVPAGTVISSTPNQGSLLPGQTVALVVSTGKPTVAVPAVAGGSMAAARSSLAAAGLGATEQDQYNDNVPRGVVVATVPPAGTAVTVGSSVTVLVSLGPHLVTVPNVAGDSVGAASQALAALGFQISGVTGNPIATVTSTSPVAGTLAHFGSPVQIVTN
jgi:serine/threonine-protein kinase